MNLDYFPSQSFLCYPKRFHEFRIDIKELDCIIQPENLVDFLAKQKKPRLIPLSGRN